MPTTEETQALIKQVREGISRALRDCYMEQLALPGVEYEHCFYFSWPTPMKYIYATFMIDDEGDLVDVDPAAPADEAVKQMERRMKGEKSWTQMSLFDE